MPVLTPFRSVLACAVLAAFGLPADAAIRMMTYNVAADVDRNSPADGYSIADGSSNTPNFTAVIQAVTKYTLAGNAQAPDVIALQELYATPSVTLTAYVNALNTAFAGTGVTYAADTLVGGSSNASLEGNGPSGLIYRTSTIKVLGSANVGTASGSGAARTPVRYQLQATGYTGANTFYVYTEHTKASQGTAEAGRRAVETAAVRADANAIVAANPTAHILYTGDFNLAGSTDNDTTSGSNEQAYQNLVAAGTSAQAIDPLTSTFTNYSSAQKKYYTESDTSLSRRYDLMLNTANVMPANFAAGLQLINNTYTAFGNSYYAAGVLSSSATYGGSIATSANAAATGISLADLQNLIDTSDHLPVIADYTIAVPEPGMLAVFGLAIGVATRRRRAAREAGCRA